MIRPCRDHTAEGMPDGELHALFYEWGAWVRSRRLYAPSPNPQSIIGTLVRLPGNREGDAPLDSRLPGLHASIMGASNRDKTILCSEYLWRPYHHPKVPVKKIASALGVSRQRWYQLVKDARRRVYAGVDTIPVAPPCQITENVD